MSDNGKFTGKEYSTSVSEMRNGAKKYIEGIYEILKKLSDVDVETMVKEMACMGYAVGVVAGELSDAGIEGFTLLLEGVRISLDVEDRKEKIQYAIWDKDGDLHTSEEGFRRKKGGEG